MKNNKQSTNPDKTSNNNNDNNELIILEELDNSEPAFYEAGAHFKYIDLYNKLLIIEKAQQQKDKESILNNYEYEISLLEKRLNSELLSHSHRTSISHMQNQTYNLKVNNINIFEVKGRNSINNKRNEDYSNFNNPNIDIDNENIINHNHTDRLGLNENINKSHNCVFDNKISNLCNDYGFGDLSNRENNRNKQNDNISRKGKVKNIKNIKVINDTALNINIKNSNMNKTKENSNSNNFEKYYKLLNISNEEKETTFDRLRIANINAESEDFYKKLFIYVYDRVLSIKKEFDDINLEGMEKLILSSNTKTVSNSIMSVKRVIQIVDECCLEVKNSLQSFQDIKNKDKINNKVKTITSDGQNKDTNEVNKTDIPKKFNNCHNNSNTDINNSKTNVLKDIKQYKIQPSTNNFGITNTNINTNINSIISLNNKSTRKILSNKFKQTTRNNNNILLNKIIQNSELSHRNINNSNTSNNYSNNSNLSGCSNKYSKVTVTSNNNSGNNTIYKKIIYNKNGKISNNSNLNNNLISTINNIVSSSHSRTQSNKINSNTNTNTNNNINTSNNINYINSNSNSNNAFITKSSLSNYVNSEVMLGNANYNFTNNTNNINNTNNTNNTNNAHKKDYTTSFSQNKYNKNNKISNSNNKNTNNSINTNNNKAEYKECNTNNSITNNFFYNKNNLENTNKTSTKYYNNCNNNNNIITSYSSNYQNIIREKSNRHNLDKFIIKDSTTNANAIANTNTNINNLDTEDLTKNLNIKVSNNTIQQIIENNVTKALQKNTNKTKTNLVNNGTNEILTKNNVNSFDYNVINNMNNTQNTLNRSLIRKANKSIASNSNSPYKNVKIVSNKTNNTNIDSNTYVSNKIKNENDDILDKKTHTNLNISSSNNLTSKLGNAGLNNNINNENENNNRVNISTVIMNKTPTHKKNVFSVSIPNNYKNIINDNNNNNNNNSNHNNYEEINVEVPLQSSIKALKINNKFNIKKVNKFLSKK